MKFIKIECQAPCTNVNPPIDDGSACVSAKEHSAMNPISTYNVGEKLRK